MLLLAPNDLYFDKGNIYILFIGSFRKESMVKTKEKKKIPQLLFFSVFYHSTKAYRSAEL